MTVQFEPLGILHTCYKEKFGIPRQPNLVKKAPATLVFYPEYAREEAVRELENFSHIWLLFLFHEVMEGTASPKSWSPMVRPPRLGGNKKVGVFASRSPFRPNPIGMSVVRLESVEFTGKGPVLHLTGVDILDQTPVLDIKPYLVYSDIIPSAKDGFASGPPMPRLKVEFSDQSLNQIRDREKAIPDLISIITGILENDPRPAYQSEQEPDHKCDRVFGIKIFDFDLKWTVKNDKAHVIELKP